jgi:hypothetical protein
MRPLPGWYAWLTVLVLAVTLPAGSLVISLHLSERADRERERARAQAEEAQRAAAAESRRVVCVAVIAQEEAWRPAESEVGKNAARAWHDLREILKCDQGG